VLNKTNRRKLLASAGAAGVSLAVGCKGDGKNQSNSASKKKSGKTFKWKMVTTWQKNFPGLGTGANTLAKYVEEMSSGQLQIKVYGAGELVPALGVFDAVSRGSAQMGHGASYYWQGKHPASPFFGAVPFGLNAHEMNGWLYYGGGLELWNELYSSFGLKAFPAGNTGVQMGGWFNKLIESPKDFKGLKVRMPGLGGTVLSKLGAVVVTLPGGEIFQSLKTGAIDGSEWVGPYNDLASGLHQAAKYYYTPGWHEPGTTLEALVNLKAYDDLPDHLQKILQHACKAANQDMVAEFNARNAQSFEKISQLKTVEVKKFNKETLSALKKISSDVLLEISKNDEMSQKIYSSFSSYQTKATKWDRISEGAYSEARRV
jgi:TRAP-type mannitol/chloroaromatic compound transport system substrate-binding protein